MNLCIVSMILTIVQVAIISTAQPSIYLDQSTSSYNATNLKVYGYKYWSGDWKHHRSFLHYVSIIIIIL